MTPEKRKLKKQADQILADVVYGREIRLDWLAREIEWHIKHREESMDNFPDCFSNDFVKGFIAGLKQAEMIMTSPLDRLCKERRSSNPPK